MAAVSPCPNCSAMLPPPPTPRTVDGTPVWAAQPYAEPVSGAVRRLKYERRVDVVPTLARLLAPVGLELAAIPGLWLVPVPLHAHRLAERGYNQSALLARAVCREWQKEPSRSRVAVAPRVLLRTRETGHQARRSRSERLDALDGAFLVPTPRRLVGRPVVLVDDVVTTGATVRACTAALRQANAEVVGVLAVCDSCPPTDSGT